MDLEEIRARIDAMEDPDILTWVTRRFLEQMLEELTAARAAEQREGAAFGLRGRTL
jgi:hypothetical protein